MSLHQIVTNKLYNKITYKEDMKFQKHLSLWDYQGSGVSAHYESRRSMGPNSPWIFTCTKENLRYITPSRSIPEINTQKLRAGKNSIITLYLESKLQRFDTLFFFFIRHKVLQMKQYANKTYIWLSICNGVGLTRLVTIGFYRYYLLSICFK